MLVAVVYVSTKKREIENRIFRYSYSWMIYSYFWHTEKSCFWGGNLFHLLKGKHRMTQVQVFCTQQLKRLGTFSTFPKQLTNLYKLFRA